MNCNFKNDKIGDQANTLMSVYAMTNKKKIKLPIDKTSTNC